MRKHTALEYFDLWLSNWKYKRLLPLRFARDPFYRDLDWWDLPFVTFSALGVVISALLNKEKIPGTVICCGGTWTMKQWDEACDWADKVLEEHRKSGIDSLQPYGGKDLQ